ncbi:MAG: adenylate/guanylate cyclase domain-containing protein [Pseudomonadota bacterium]
MITVPNARDAQGQQPPPRALSSGERRQITALFYDITGSTAMMTSMDPEDYMDLQARIHEAAAEAITANGGHIDQVMGDGATVYFGYPNADEDASQKAVTAGLEIIERCRELDDGDGEPIRLRIGIATALAVFGQHKSASVGHAKGPYAEIVGVAPNLAARLQSLAEPNTVLVSNNTYRITHRLFEFDDFGKHELKGFPDTHRVWRAVKALEVDDRFAGHRSAAAPFVAREAELELALDRWREVKNGVGQVLFLSGEAGIGKSRLTRAIRQGIGGVGSQILSLQCHPHSQSIPLFPFINGIRSELRQRIPDFDFSAISGDAIRRTLDLPASLSGDICDTLSFLLTDETSRERRGDALVQQEFGAQAIDAVVQTLWGVAAAAPCVVIVEDLHWADRQTLETLDRITREITSHGVLKIVTSRDALGPEWRELKGVTEIALGPLDKRYIAELVQAISGRDHFSDELLSAIYDKSDGVPFFAEELARFLDEQGDLVPTSDVDWHIFSSDGVVTLQNLLMARLAALGDDRLIVQAASVIGRNFSTEMLVGLFIGVRDAANVENALDALVDRGFLRLIAGEIEPEYAFKHALLRHAAYESLLKADRRKVHGRIFDLALAEDGPATGLSEAELAHHAEQAGMMDEAVTHLIKAGRLASQQSALYEARALLDKAENLMGRIERDGGGADRMLELIATLGPVLTTLEGAGSARARGLYDRGVTLCREDPKVDRTAWFPVYWGWWFTAPNFEAQRDRSDVIIADMTNGSSTEAQLQALHCGWATAFNTGRHSACLEAVDQGLALYDSEDATHHRAHYGGHDAKVCALGERALSQWFTGATKSALVSLQRAKEWSDEIDHLGSLCHVLDIEIMLHRYRCDTDAVAETARQMAQIAGEHRLRSFEAKSLIFGGWAEGLSGDLQSGHDKLSDGLKIQHEIGTEEDFPVYYEMWAELKGLLHLPNIGIGTVDNAIERAEASGHLFWLSELYRRRGLLLADAKSDEVGIAASFTQAATVARKQNATVLTLRALTDLAECAPAMSVTDAWRAETSELLSRLEPDGERDRLSARLDAIVSDKRS